MSLILSKRTPVEYVRKDAQHLNGVMKRDVNVSKSWINDLTLDPEWFLFVEKPA